MKKHRVTWEDIGPCGDLEILHDTFLLTREYCIACGKRGTWAGGDDHRLCTGCLTLVRLGDQPIERIGTDFWSVIARQLQLAEAAAA